MGSVEHDIDSWLALLRTKIRERGFTQLEVQEALGWGRAYISQLLTKQKPLRAEQTLLILSVIGVEPGEFFGELFCYQGANAPAGAASRYAGVAGDAGASSAVSAADFREMRSTLGGLVESLVDRELIDREELSARIRSVASAQDS